jgi:hypothetical protein
MMIVYSKAISATGEIFGIKTLSYHSLLFALSKANLVMIPAAKGIPR